MKKSLSLTSLLMLFALCGCTTPANTSSAPATSVKEEDPLKVQVIVMSGQSNMEGSTYYDNGQGWLRNACTELEQEGHDPIDADLFFNGMPDVQCSYRGYYPYGGGDPAANAHASNTTDKMAGKFLNLKVGMGQKDVAMGPEIGLGNVLHTNEIGTEEKPVYLIKSAFSGSSFKKQGNSKKHWKIASDNDGEEGELWTETKQFVKNNLALIEEAGFHPEIKAWLWHQGESDTDNNDQASEEQYGKFMRDLLAEFREEFAEYAPEEDGDNIAFVDCTIYDGTRLSYSGVDTLNATKKAISEDSDNNYLINASCKDSEGLGLEIGGQQNLGGCYDTYHYVTKDLFRLGEAYGNILVENEIIE